jgi:ribosomal-protein-alanine N-acetyltransferase
MRVPAADVSVTSFRIRDLPQVLDIENLCFAEEAYPEELLRELAGKPSAVFLVARSEDRILGYAVAVLRGRSAELISIAVHPGYRRGGVGQALLDAVLRRLRRAGAASCRLAVRTSNSAAIAFYEKNGFRRLKLLRRYYADDGDAFLMRKSLRPARGRSR